MTNILVTGGAGFIGSNFIHYWLREHKEDNVINFDKLTYAGHLASLRDVKTNPNYKFIKGDICNTRLVDKAMEGIDIVVHFAAESHVDRSITNPGVFLKTNVIGTQVLLDASLKHKVKRFHQIGTDEVFGSLDLDSKEKFTEGKCYDPRSPYAASKAGADHLVRAYHETYGLPITITNCSNNFGPYQDTEKLLPKLITNLIDGKKLPIYGDGKNVRDWLYVEDHVRAIEAVLDKDKRIAELLMSLSGINFQGRKPEKDPAKTVQIHTFLITIYDQNWHPEQLQIYLELGQKNHTSFELFGKKLDSKELKEQLFEKGDVLSFTNFIIETGLADLPEYSDILDNTKSLTKRLVNHAANTGNLELVQRYYESEGKVIYKDEKIVETNKVRHEKGHREVTFTVEQIAKTTKEPVSEFIQEIRGHSNPQECLEKLKEAIAEIPVEFRNPIIAAAEERIRRQEEA